MKTYSITNENNLKVVTHPLGARLVSIFTPDRNGRFADVIQGFDTEEGYLTKGKSQGAICGRFANRIANAQFKLNGEQYNLPANNGKHTLHSGNGALRTAHWSVKDHSTNQIIYTYHSPHLENGFPGTVNFSVTYTISRHNELIIQLEAETDRETHINLTSHPYFNLRAEGNGNVLEHKLQINSDHFLEIDQECIPTGEFISVENTVFDFRQPTEIGNRVKSNHPQIELVKGYDHCFAFQQSENETTELNAVVIDSFSGRVLKVFSDYPGMQLYTANDLSVLGKEKKAYQPYSAICLEPQYFPNSPNEPDFPCTIFSPENNYQHKIIYQFETLQYG